VGMARHSPDIDASCQRLMVNESLLSFVEAVEKPIPNFRGSHAGKSTV
jgi:hypothetical protein